MSVVQSIRQAAVVAVNSLYNQQVTEADIAINTTKPEFEGEYTIVVFTFTKFSRQKPEETAQRIGEYLVAHNPELISKFNVVKGFLNLSINDAYWLNYLQQQFQNTNPGMQPSNGKKIMVEYSSPNTNKPLHLGHLRNNFLGFSIAEIIKANGYEVIKANLVNDRGIHICKSMLAWQMFAHGDTPKSTGIKGDHLVGDYYVKFETVVKEQAEIIIDRALESDFQDFDEAETQKLEKLVTALHKPEVKADKEKTAKIMGDIKEMSRNKTEIMQQAKIMLQQWEAGNPEVRELWGTMNSWVYEGFDETYKRLGIDFDQMYFESETYLLGKDLVAEGLRKGVLFKKEDNSVWIDLTADGLDQKLLLRGDGTSVYMTQDLGTARLKYDQYQMEKSMYVVADEQNYHFKVLQLILQKLGEPSADGIVHLSYGMVELPEGRMKSREGTVVDADDLIDEMISTAEQKTQESAKNLDSFSEEELRELYKTVGIGSMKFFLLRVDSKKKMIFDPSESIDLHGFTGPFVQYAYARIKSILRDPELGEVPDLSAFDAKEALLPLEKELIILNEQFSTVVADAYKELSPSVIANYAFQLAQTFNSFYAEKVDGIPTYSVKRAASEDKKYLRIQLITHTANTLKQSLKLLGIGVPERM
ncbi:arginine--tRNA ligase [Chitinophaga silvatica]|uniref:Arginine--tRNA ligase n=1 Tax=Chitinophaga silvatica TaxID=2282649 RepID=A0A3E1YEQ4_9BACT|nr:arginine--tRNA ligase [Chitinophaga silvatica]RFS25008.1 arginine--tRNA ligase [Chitinophaga silvatica]